MSQIEITKRVLQSSTVDVSDGDLFELEVKDATSRIQLSLTVVDMGAGQQMYAVKSQTNPIMLLNGDGSPANSGTSSPDTGTVTPDPDPDPTPDPDPEPVNMTYQASLVNFTAPVSVRSIAGDVVRIDSETGDPVVVNTFDYVMTTAGTLTELFESLDDEFFLNNVQAPMFEVVDTDNLTGIASTVDENGALVGLEAYDAAGVKATYTPEDPAVALVYGDYRLVIRSTADVDVVAAEDMFTLLSDLAVPDQTLRTGAAKANAQL